MCLVFAFAPALSLFVFHFLFCSAGNLSTFLIFLWVFQLDFPLQTGSIVPLPRRGAYVLLLVLPVPLPYVLHFPLCLDIRYLCVHLPHRFAVLLASLRPEENYMFWFLTENCWATQLPMEETEQRPEQSLIESSLELFKQSILMTHSKQSSNFI